MKQLEELEKKVLQVIQKNKELQEENDLLKLEKEELKERNCQLESTLMNENKSSETLTQEKKKIKSSIEELLDSISSLEDKNKEATK